MATGTVEPAGSMSADVASAVRSYLVFRAGIHTLFMKALSSLKLTVALFAYGIFVIFVGTLAQTQMDIWQVVPLYFRSLVMWVDVNLFFPPSFFPGMPHLDVPAIPMPGGLVVGSLMLVNLAAAHAWRFQIQAKGTRLLVGLGAMALGILVTAAIIVSGNLGSGAQAKPLLTPIQIWVLFLTLAGLGWGLSTYFFGRYAVQEFSTLKNSGFLLGLFRLRVVFLFGGAYVALSSLYYSLLSGALQPPTEAMRILWQLMQGTAAGLVLLAGCWLLFGKRAGIVLLHGGVVLMMVSELVVARYAIEWQMTLEEGQAANFVRDIRTTELAIVDRSTPEAESVIVVPRKLLEANAAANQRLATEGKDPQPIRDRAGTHELLPFDITVVRYLRNHDVRQPKADEKLLATAGVGLNYVAEEARAAKGTDSESGVDVGAVYARLTEKKTNRDLGTYLVSQLSEPGVGMSPEKFVEHVEAGGKEYDLLLRFERAYKPYTVKLKDVRKDDYLGSDTPRNYSSDVQLVDSQSSVDSSIHIKMNDPLRYRGDTFYQSSYAPAAPFLGRRETTTLAIVNNIGWMIPYTACMIVVVGLVFHFSTILQRFLNRRSEEEGFARKSAPAVKADHRPEIAAMTMALVIAAGYMGSTLHEKPIPADKPDVAEFGKLPVVHSGRVKPIDTLARNSLRALSNYETVNYGKDGKRLHLSATAWLLDSVTGNPEAFDYRVIKVDNPDLIKLFDLKPQPRGLYSLEQIVGHSPELRRMAMAAHDKKQKSPESLTALDRKALELDERLRLYEAVMMAFNPPQLPPLPSEEETKSDPEAARQKFDKFRLKLMEVPQEAKALGLPLLVPVKGRDQKTADGNWLAYPTAWSASFVQARLLGEEGDPATIKIEEMLSAYRAEKAADFNRALRQYQAEVARIAPQDFNADRVRTEAYFNFVSPFYVGSALYLLALVVALAGWLLQSRPANIAAITLIAVTFLFHTAALIVRIYISGRPPVTNLYSSAIFIGWGAVLFCLVLETVYLNGLGNVIGALTGFAALLISYFLSAGGDTIAVLQAVLDTQIWLATHVVCITLGYTATYVAGFFGLCYVLFGLCTPLLSAKMRSELARIIYGVTCFAVLLSFFGTVLGGLWADDSWGRFWGWDPKENGALIIVLWNALVLHAKWDKLVKDRGLAVLSIGGNIVTSWSWFGVNELGVGLHSYGFTEGVLLALIVFAASQAGLMVVGLLPTKYWWSYAAERNQGFPVKAEPV